MTEHTKALLDLSKLLSPAVVNNTELKDIMLSQDTPWDEIIDFANQHLLIPALHDALQQKDLIKLVKNEKMVEYLSTVYEFNRIRNEAILVQVQEICHLFAEIDVTPVLLKGASALSEGHYHSIGARVMVDLDILVPEDKIFKCIELLKSKGKYKLIDEEKSSWSIDDHHHYLRIYNDDGVAALELHHHALAKEAYPYLTDQKLMEHVRKSKIIDNAYVIEPTFEFYHAFLHSEISSYAHTNNTFRLRHLQQAAIIATVCQKEMNWNLLEAEAEKHGISSIWGDYLYIQKRLFEVDIPPEMIGSQKHFQDCIYLIENNGEKKTMALFYFTRLKQVLSYEDLKKRYDLKSRLEYPKALLKYLFSLFSRFAFSSDARKNAEKFHKKLMKSSQYGQ